MNLLEAGSIRSDTTASIGSSSAAGATEDYRLDPLAPSAFRSETDATLQMPNIGRIQFFPQDAATSVFADLPVGRVHLVSPLLSWTWYQHVLVTGAFQAMLGILFLLSATLHLCRAALGTFPGWLEYATCILHAINVFLVTSVFLQFDRNLLWSLFRRSFTHLFACSVLLIHLLCDVYQARAEGSPLVTLVWMVLWNLCLFSGLCLDAYPNSQSHIRFVKCSLVSIVLVGLIRLVYNRYFNSSVYVYTVHIKIFEYSTTTNMLAQSCMGSLIVFLMRYLYMATVRPYFMVTLQGAVDLTRDMGGVRTDRERRLRGATLEKMYGPDATYSVLPPDAFRCFPAFDLQYPGIFTHKY
jgi:hypothetical protein